ncbi:MAG TPA: succinyl-diaminopimelate desuccinylase [Propionicimonas sp.]|jgi:succinyl-diaminopimelate desuccinylase|nr:succinyl-diaminopimelate desuccinylase [Propionicimonas sp.]
MALDPDGDLLRLFRDIVDIESVSGDEARLADAVETALRGRPHLDVVRDGDTVVARTRLGRPERVLVAGHLDTVPVAGNLPSQVVGEVVFGRGTADMKGGVAVMLALAVALEAPSRDLTWIFYDHEEVAAEENSLTRLAAEHPEWLAADFAVLMEPTSARVEGGCQGTLRVALTTHGRAAHSGRSWLGHNAIHDAADVLTRLQRYGAREVEVDGLVYREGLNAVGISGGIAGNVIPDRCTVTVNFRFAPDRSEAEALAHCREVFAGHDLVVVDSAPGARPGLDRPIAQDFLAAVGGEPSAKFGWTDVARFSALGVPAVNYGPADPGKAHADDECCPIADLYSCRDALVRWLS